MTAVHLLSRIFAILSIFAVNKWEINKTLPVCFSIYKKKKKFDDAVELRCVRRHSMSSATLCISSHYVRRHKRFAFYIILCPSLRRNNYLHYDRCYIIPDNTSDQNVFTICLPLWITRHLLKKITFFLNVVTVFCLKIWPYHIVSVTICRFS